MTVTFKFIPNTNIHVLLMVKFWITMEIHQNFLLCGIAIISLPPVTTLALLQLRTLVLLMVRYWFHLLVEFRRSNFHELLGFLLTVANNHSVFKLSCP